MAHELDSQTETYTPDNEYYENAYFWINQETGLTADNFNEMWKSFYDKINYLKNNLNDIYDNIFNLSYKLGVDRFTKLNGSVSSSLPSTIIGSDTYFLHDLQPGNVVKINITADSVAYFTVKSVTSNTEFEIYEIIDAGSAFATKHIYRFEILEDYDLVDSQLTSALDRSIKGIIEYIGDVLYNVDQKLTNVINALGFDQATGQAMFEYEDLTIYLAALENDINIISTKVSNIIASIGLKPDGTKNDFTSTNYIDATDSLIEAIENLDSWVYAALAGCASTTDLDKLIATVGATADGDHPNYPASRIHITSHNENVINTLLELDSKMNKWPGNIDIILDPSTSGGAYRDNVVATWSELATYINANGPNLNIFVLNPASGSFQNDAGEDAPVFEIPKISGCSFYSNKVVFHQSIILLGGPTAPETFFKNIQFHNFIFGPATIASQDGYTANFNLNRVGGALTPGANYDQVLFFDECYFESYTRDPLAVMTGYDFITLNSPASYATKNATVVFNACTSAFSVTTVANINQEGYKVACAVSSVPSILNVYVKDCHMNFKMKTPATDVEVGSCIVEDSKLENALELFDIGEYVVLFKASGCEFKYKATGITETDDYFLNVVSATPTELSKVEFSDVLISHSNPIHLEGHKGFFKDVYFESERVLTALTMPPTEFPFVKKVFDKLTLKDCYHQFIPGDTGAGNPNMLEGYLEIAQLVTSKYLHISDIIFDNPASEQFATAGVTPFILLVSDAYEGVIQNISFHHDPGVGAPIQHFIQSSSYDKILVKNITHLEPVTECPLTGYGAGWLEGHNRNIIYLGQGTAYQAGDLYDFAANTLLDLGEFVIVPNPDTLMIMIPGLYRISVHVALENDFITVGAPPQPEILISGNTFENTGGPPAPPVPVGPYYMLPLLSYVGAGILPPGVNGETSSLDIALSEGVTIQFHVLPPGIGVTSTIRFCLERIK